MSTEADVKLSPGGERLLRGLARALIDPGELTWEEAMAAVPTAPQGLARIAYRLHDDGLVTLDGWNGSTYTGIRLTQAGWAVCRERQFPTGERS